MIYFASRNLILNIISYLIPLFTGSLGYYMYMLLEKYVWHGDFEELSLRLSKDLTVIHIYIASESWLPPGLILQNSKTNL